MKMLTIILLVLHSGLTIAGDTKVVTLPDGKTMTCQTTSAGIVCY